MAGIRLRHPTLRSGEGTTVTYVVELPQPYDVTPKPGARLRSETPCPSCGKAHANKAVHLRLDSDGCVIVSMDVYLKLQQVHLAGLELVNEVDSPPPLLIGAVPKAKERLVEVSLNGHKGELITPSRTRYESRDLLHKPFQPILEAEAERVDREKTKKLRRIRRLFT